MYIKKDKNKISNEDKIMEQSCVSLLSKINENVKSYEIYKLKKELKSIKNIIDFNDAHKEVK